MGNCAGTDATTDPNAWKMQLTEADIRQMIIDDLYLRFGGPDGTGRPLVDRAMGDIQEALDTATPLVYAAMEYNQVETINKARESSTQGDALEVAMDTLRKIILGQKVKDECPEVPEGVLFEALVNDAKYDYGDEWRNFPECDIDFGEQISYNDKLKAVVDFLHQEDLEDLEVRSKLYEAIITSCEADSEYGQCSDYVYRDGMDEKWQDKITEVVRDVNIFFEDMGIEKRWDDLNVDGTDYWWSSHKETALKYVQHVVEELTIY